MDELISKQAVLECFHDWIDRYGDVHTADEMSEYRAIEALPSVEPKIIRCNECKWNRTENRKETKQWLPCRAIVTPDDFSCIYAEGKANG